MDVGCLRGVFCGAGGGEGGREDDEADVLACDAADEEEERGVDVGTEGAFGSRWGRRVLFGWRGIEGVLWELLARGIKISLL